MRNRVKKQQKRRRPKKRWGEWPDEEVPKRGTRQMTPLERALK